MKDRYVWLAIESGRCIPHMAPSPQSLVHWLHAMSTPHDDSAHTEIWEFLQSGWKRTCIVHLYIQSVVANVSGSIPAGNLCCMSSPAPSFSCLPLHLQHHLSDKGKSDTYLHVIFYLMILGCIHEEKGNRSGPFHCFHNNDAEHIKKAASHIFTAHLLGFWLFTLDRGQNHYTKLTQRCQCAH